jgi:hypothetical protein
LPLFVSLIFSLFSELGENDSGMDERVVSAELEQIEPHEVDNESLFLTKY